MGRWAQAERRGSADDREGMPRVINGTLVGTPELELEWNASGNPTTWEGEVWDVDFQAETTRGFTVEGHLREIETGVTSQVDHVYHGRVRPWLGNRPGAWGPEWELVA